MAAMPVRRVDAPRPRSSGVRRAAPTPANRRRTGTRPELRIVPRPRAAVNAALVLGAVVVVLMLGTVVLHTRLAERQVEIDRLEEAVTEPASASTCCASSGPSCARPPGWRSRARNSAWASPPQTEFLTVDPQTLAEVIAAAGIVDEVTGEVVTADPLDQIRRVKAATGQEP